MKLEGVIAIVRTKEPVDLLATCQALAEGGFRFMEITLNTPGALEGIGAARRALEGRAVVGAGTILNANDARRAMAHGAEFIVTPTLQPDSVAVCNEAAVPICCGAMTPTEILAAHRAGADYVKLFPASVLGPDYIRNVLGPLPFIQFVPTGGIGLNNVAEYLKVCPAVGVGGNLVDLDVLRAGDWSEVTRRARRYVEAASGQ